jgi:hypothetical protein
MKNVAQIKVNVKHEIIGQTQPQPYDTCSNATSPLLIHSKDLTSNESALATNTPASGAESSVFNNGETDAITTTLVTY